MSGYRSPDDLRSSSASFGIQQDPLRQLHNQAQNLTTQIQCLLDAQSEALMREESAMQFSSPVYRPQSSTAHQPKSLSDARNELRTAIQALADVKSREATTYGDLAAERHHFVSSLSQRTEKASKLREELSTIRAGPESTKAEDLRTESCSVAFEIAETEKRLASLKAKKKRLDEDISELDNIVASRGASYEGSLKDTVAHTAAFLRAHGQSSVDVAMETWKREGDSFTEKMEAATMEAEALSSGVFLWEDVLRTVRKFERTLRQKFKEGPKRKSETVKELRSDLELAMGELEEMAERARNKKWKLLEVCIGAEIQAFREAAEVLHGEEDAEGAEPLNPLFES